MAEEPKPTLDEPEVKEPETNDIDDLLKELEAAGVSNKEQLQGKLKASREAGQLAQMLGQTRQQNEELKQMIQQMQTQNKTEYDDFNSQPVDLERSIETTIERVISKREKAQQEAQQRLYQQWSEIQSDEDYNLVKGVWEEKTKDPNFAFQIQNGAVDPVKEYAKVVRQFYKGLAVKSAAAMRQFKEGGSDVKPPHVEGQSEVNKEVQDTTEEQEIIDSFKERVDKGGSLSEDDELKALEAILKG